MADFFNTLLNVSSPHIVARMDELSGTVCADSINNRDGVYTSVDTTASLVSSISGIERRQILEGSSGHILHSPSDLRPTGNVGSIVAILERDVDAPDTVNGFFWSLAQPLQAISHMYVGYATDGTLVIDLRIDFSQSYTLRFNTFVVPESETLLMVTQDGTGVRVYTNNPNSTTPIELIPSSIVTTAPVSTWWNDLAADATNSTIGAFDRNGIVNNFFKGSISTWGMYTEALTVQELEDLNIAFYDTSTGSTRNIWAGDDVDANQGQSIGIGIIGQTVIG